MRFALQAPQAWGNKRRTPPPPPDTATAPHSQLFSMAGRKEGGHAWLMLQI